MTVSFGAITRGTGKIFTTVFAPVPQGGRLAEARTRGGNPLPSAVFPKETNRYVVVLPVLHSEIVLTVRVLDANGGCVEEAHRSFGHALTAMKSKANTFLKNADALSIRNIDSRVSPEESEVVVTHIVANGDGDGRAKPIQWSAERKPSCPPKPTLMRITRFAYSTFRERTWRSTG